MDSSAITKPTKPSPTTNNNSNSANNAPHVEDLLCYLPDYRVLICKDCHFAIQPSALSSHLLRHGFYRGNRKKVTKNLAQLDLAEPDDVPVPGCADDAIRELPVHEGFICEFDEDDDGGGGGCGHACMAEKRMAAHWREVHDRHHVSEVKARKARLQTFFRGSKTRYFEVEKDRPVGDVVKVEARPVLVRGETAEKFYREQTAGGGEEGASLGPELQLHDLKLLHHWHTLTGKTIARGRGEEGWYWAGKITDLALDCEFLMRSILAMSALHAVHLGIRNGAAREEVRSNHNAALTHHCRALADFRKALEGGMKAENAVQFAASARLMGLAFGAGVVSDKWLDENSHPDSPREFFIRSFLGPLGFLLLVRGSAEIQLTAQNVFTDGSPFHIPDEILQVFVTGSPVDTDSKLDPRIAPCVRAANALKGPMTDSEVLDSSLAALSYCFTGGLPPNKHPLDEHNLWMHGQVWPRLVSEEYLSLLQAEDPAALMVYAHWCLLVRRLETFSWYLEGMSARLIGGIADMMKTPQGDGYEVLMRTLEETEALL